MGIHQLTKVIGDNAPNSIKDNSIKNYFGRKIAIDASMCLYQFLIAARPDSINTLMDESGETTSHILGLFHRTIKLISNGIKPIFVFDGQAPILKSEELAKRKQKREEAQEEVKNAQENGDMETLAKFNKRTVRVTLKHNEEAKKLLKLMGVPIVEAPGEAEAQCAAMTKSGIVYATASEDMDSLTFGTPILLRYLTFSKQGKSPIKEIYLDKLLEEMELTMDKFIDLCILLGCDYCNSIRGIGPVRALEFIRKYGSLEEIIKNLDTKKYTIPENFDYITVRKLFKEPAIIDPKKIELKWLDPDENGLIEFLVKDKGFNEERVKKGILKLKKSRTVSVQDRITSYFSISTINTKRKSNHFFSSSPKKIKDIGKKEIGKKEKKKKILNK